MVRFFYFLTMEVDAIIDMIIERNDDNAIIDKMYLR